MPSDPVFPPTCRLPPSGRSFLLHHCLPHPFLIRCQRTVPCSCYMTGSMSLISMTSNSRFFTLSMTIPCQDIQVLGRCSRIFRDVTSGLGLLSTSSGMCAHVPHVNRPRVRTTAPTALSNSFQHLFSLGSPSQWITSRDFLCPQGTTRSSSSSATSQKWLCLSPLEPRIRQKT